MNAAEIKLAREYMGLSQAALAALVGVSSRSIRFWEEGNRPAPERATQTISALMDATDETVDQLTTEHDETITVYPDDPAFHAAHPQWAQWPATWHRMVVARATRSTGTRVMFG